MALWLGEVDVEVGMVFKLEPKRPVLDTGVEGSTLTLQVSKFN